MISLTLGQLLTTYVAGLVLVLLLLSVGRTLLRNLRESRSLRRQIQCALCGTLFENSGGNPLPPCPNCAHPNERVPPVGP